MYNMIDISEHQSKIDADAAQNTVAAINDAIEKVSNDKKEEEE